MASNTYETVYNALMQSIEDRKTGFDQKTVDFNMTFKDLTKELDASKKQIEAFKKSMVRQLQEKDEEIKKINAEKKIEISELMKNYAQELEQDLQSKGTEGIEKIKALYEARIQQQKKDFEEEETKYITHESKLENMYKEIQKEYSILMNICRELEEKLRDQDTTQKQSFQNSSDHKKAEAALQQLKDVYQATHENIYSIMTKVQENAPNAEVLDELLEVLTFFFDQYHEILELNETMCDKESQRKTSKAGKERPIIYKKGVPSYENICRKTTGLYGISEESLIASDKATCVPKEFFVIDT